MLIIYNLLFFGQDPGLHIFKSTIRSNQKTKECRTTQIDTKGKYKHMKITPRKQELRTECRGVVLSTNIYCIVLKMNKFS